MKFDLISVIFRLYGLSAVFRNFLKNVKTLEPKTYITILSIPSVISGQNIEESIFSTLCRPSRGAKGEWLLTAFGGSFASIKRTKKDNNVMLQREQLVRGKEH